MPELVAKFTPPAPAVHPPPPAALPREWEALCVFRETFLVWLTPPGAAEAFRFIGNLFFDLMLSAEDWPTWTESPIQAELQGAARDLRFLEGFLTTVGAQKASELSRPDASLSRLAARLAPEVGRLALQIEQELREVDS
jgi:hypothetical protein